MKVIWHNYKWLIIISIVVIIVTTLPYCLGFKNQNENYRFSGFIIGVEDGNSYLAKMMLGSSGKWLFTSPYTAYPQVEFFAFFPYILLGKLAAFPEQTLQFILLFHLFRIIGIIFLIYETYNFAQLFVEDKKTSTLISLFLITGGGLGWLGILFPSLVENRMPLEFYSPETFGFLSAFSLPHLLFGRALLYRSFRKFLFTESNDNSPKSQFFTGGVWLLLSGVFQPLNLFIGWVVVGTYSLFKILTKRFEIRQIVNSFFWLLPSLPLFFYNSFSFIFDPYLSSWQSQNRIISPPVVDYLLAYGLGVVFIVIAIKKNYVTKIKHTTFLYSWLFLLPILVYLPVNIQRRLSEGVWLCFCVFIAIVLMNIKRKNIVIAIVPIFLFSNLLFIFGAFSTVNHLSTPVYIPNPIIEVADNLRSEIEIDDVILAPFFESNVLPAYLPVRVITGHGPESKNLEEISITLNMFYEGKLSDQEIKEFFEFFNVEFVLIPQNYDQKMILRGLNSFSINPILMNEEYLVIKINEYKDF